MHVPDAIKNEYKQTKSIEITKTENEILPKEFRTTEFMKYLPNTFIDFFAQRAYTYQNFHFYIKVLSSQNLVDKIPEVLDKMKVS